MLDTDIIIVGAGVTGLSAALELKRQGHRYLILEAAAHVGGRARTIRTASGTAVDLGAHWLHGKDNPLKKLLSHYNIAYSEDKAAHVKIYQNGEVHESRVDKWLEKAVDPKKAKQVKRGSIPDMPLPDLASDEESRERLTAFGRMWNGIDPPVFPSAREFLTEESTPGGLQPREGIGMLLEKIADDIGRQHIHFNMPVEHIASRLDGVHLQGTDGKSWSARKALFTGSLGVIQSGIVTFQPALSHGLRRELGMLAMGRMNKIVVELSPAFFEERKIPVDLALELLDSCHFCHARSAGAPLVHLFISGSRANAVEGMSNKEAIAYLKEILSPVKELAGFERHIIGEPIVSKWGSDPYIRGSYSICLPGGSRPWPREEGHVFLCGDTFDKRFPGSMAGAFRSGKTAALMVAESLQETIRGLRQ